LLYFIYFAPPGLATSVVASASGDARLYFM